MIYSPLFRLTLSVLERTEDAARAYAVVLDPSAGTSGVYIGGVPWSSSYFPDAGAPTFVPGPLGLVSLRTQETFQAHGASAALLLGSVGEVLRKKIRPHDLLRIELFEPSTQRWRCAFDGHLVNIQWTRQSSPDSYRWRMDISAQGVQKIFSEQWVNWQAMIQALNTKDSPFGKGYSFYQELNNLKPNQPMASVLKFFATGAVNQFLDFGVRGQKAAFGATYQTADVVPGGNSRDWQTAFGLFVLATGAWYLTQNGPVWNLMSGLAERDVHEFYLSYGQDPNSSVYREIPTLVFRPRPWPGPPASAVTAQISPKVDDDSIWRSLEVKLAGVPGAPVAINVSTSWNDAVRPNSFLMSLSGSSDNNPNGLTADKVYLKFRVDRNLVARYGFSSRQVSIGGNLQSDMATFFQVTLPGVLDRVAWQEAPLPFLLDQSRTFPLWPGVRPGMVLEDHSESDSSPTTGYVLSVSHTISGTPKSLRAETLIGTTRALEGVTAAGYPEAVRKFVNLEVVGYADLPETAKPMQQYADPSHSQPAAPGVAADTSPQTGKPYDLFVSSYPQYQDKNPDASIQANLKYLQENGIKAVESLVGPIVLTSVYRSPRLNFAIGGASTSDHLKGLAFDFQMPGGAGDLPGAYEKILAASGTLQFKAAIFETRKSDNVQWIHYAIYPAGDPGWTSGPHRTEMASTGD